MDKRQKYHRGDLVAVQDGADKREALIIGSYADQYGSGGHDPYNTYTVLFTADGSQVSWFYGQQMEYIRHAGDGAIDEAKENRRVRDEKESQIDWIIANWNPEKMPGASLQALWDACGCRGSMWGSNGEGCTWYSNARKLIHLFDGPMLSGDLANVNARIAEVKTLLSA